MNEDLVTALVEQFGQVWCARFFLEDEEFNVGEILDEKAILANSQFDTTEVLGKLGIEVKESDIVKHFNADNVSIEINDAYMDESFKLDLSVIVSYSPAILDNGQMFDMEFDVKNDELIITHHNSAKGYSSHAVRANKNTEVLTFDAGTIQRYLNARFESFLDSLEYDLREAFNEFTYIAIKNLNA